MKTFQSLRDATAQNKKSSSINERPLFLQSGNRRFSTSPEADKISTFRSALPQFLAVGVKNTLMFVYGMTLGFPTIVIPAIQGGDGRETGNNDIILNKNQISWFSSISLICVPLGCVISGPLSQPIGKRKAMQLVNLPILASWLLFHFATNTEHLYAALCLAGLGGGLLEAPVLTYVAEVTQPKYRGMLSSMGSTCVVTGSFVIFIMGSFLDWRTIAAVSSAFPVISIICLFFVPESPTWLIRKHRYREAVKSLQWLRGWVSENSVEAEFNELYDDLITRPADELAAEKAAGTSPSNICFQKMRLWRKRSFLQPFFLVSFVFFIGHFSGKTSLQTYAVQIFNALKAPINKYHATLLLGLAELIATILCVALIHFTGKRPLIFMSTIGVSVCFFGTATYAHFLKDIPGFSVNNIVTNVSLTLSPDNIITQQKITHIFEREQQELLQSAMAKAANLQLNKTYNENQRTKRQTNKQVGYNGNSTEVDGSDPEISFSDLSALDYNDATAFPEWLNHNVTENFEDYTTTTTTESEIVTKILPKNEESLTSNKKSATVRIPTIAEVANEVLIPVPQQERNSLAWLPMCLLLGAAFSSHIGIRNIPWVLTGEVFPASIRSTASGLSGAAGYIFGFLANKLFLQMLDTLTLAGTFWLYSGVALFGCIVLYFIQPETEGVSLADIEAHFSNKSDLNLMSKKSKAKYLADFNRNTNIDSKPNVIQMQNLDTLQVPISPYTEAKIIQLQQSDLAGGHNNLAFEDNNTTHL